MSTGWSTRAGSRRTRSPHQTRRLLSDVRRLKGRGELIGLREAAHLLGLGCSIGDVRDLIASSELTAVPTRRRVYRQVVQAPGPCPPGEAGTAAEMTSGRRPGSPRNVSGRQRGLDRTTRGCSPGITNRTVAKSGTPTISLPLAGRHTPHANTNSHRRVPFWVGSGTGTRQSAFARRSSSRHSNGVKMSCMARSIFPPGHTIVFGLDMNESCSMDSR
jgi:hypothetical protein